MSLSKRIFLTSLYLVFLGNLFAQDKSAFLTVGNNVQKANCTEIIFQGNSDEQQRIRGNGAAWYPTPVDLSQKLDISYFAFYKFKSGPAKVPGNDGFAFVLQSAGTNVLGDPTSGIGFKNLQPSLAVTFDCLQDAADNDPPFDHISLQINGDTKHSSPNNLSGPVNIEPLFHFYPGAPDETIFYSFINIKWNPASQLIEVYVDSILMLSATNDIINTVFKGDTKVNWGFTCSNTYTPLSPGTGEIRSGFTRLYFGAIFPGFTTKPNLDTCFNNPIHFFDDSHYDYSELFNSVDLAKWYWDFGNGNISNLRNPPPQNYPGPGEYALKFTVSNQIGCTVDTLIKIIKLGSSPVIDFATSEICENNPAVFTDKTITPVGNANSWTWIFDNNIISRERNASVKLPGHGTKTISLIVHTSLYCADTLTKIIDIHKQPKISFSTLKDCDRNVQYQAFLENNVSINKWNWNFGDGRFSSLQNPSHHFSQNGLFTTKLYALSTDGCSSDTLEANINIQKLVPFAGNDTLISRSQQLQLKASGGINYTWSPAIGLSNQFIADPIANLSASQTYILSVRNEDGCEAKDTLNVAVYKKTDLYLPNAFTPDNDGKNDVFRVIGPGIRNLEYFRVFNRGGQLLFETVDIRKGWDGRLNNVLQPAGTFVWMIRAKDYKENTISRTGTIILVR